jgi:hypothetical protein
MKLRHHSNFVADGGRYGAAAKRDACVVLRIEPPLSPRDVRYPASLRHVKSIWIGDKAQAWHGAATDSMLPT